MRIASEPESAPIGPLMGTLKTEQEKFWAGEFGSDYTVRNAPSNTAAGNLALFATIMRRAPGVSSVLELGANRGNNLRALQSLLPNVTLAAVEINPVAFAELQTMDGVEATLGSILDYSPPRRFDMVLIKGVLIHIAPEELPRVYDVAERASARYICLCEYYNPTPVEVPYRGQRNKLFKRDFAGEMLDRFHNLALRDYGFVYHRDPAPLDDCTWFLLERHS